MNLSLLLWLISCLLDWFAMWMEGWMSYSIHSLWAYCWLKTKILRKKLTADVLKEDKNTQKVRNEWLF